MSELKTAKELRELCLKNRAEAVYESINKAVAEGKTEVDVPNWKVWTVTEELVNKGFSLTDSVEHRFYTCISWRPKDT